MTVTYYPNLAQGSDEWLAARCGILTASVIGNLITVGALTATDVECPDCGAEPHLPCRSKLARKETVTIKTFHAGRHEHAKWQAQTAPPILEVADNETSRAVTATLAAERITGHVDATYVSADMWRGKDDEPYARDAYTEHFAPVQEMGFIVRDDDTRIGYSPDGLVGDDGLIEVKSRRQKNQLLAVLDNTIPHMHMAQMECGLYVTGRQWCDYISFAGGMHLWVRRVYPDPDWFDVIAAAARTFETNCAAMIASYNAAVAGLPLTERPPEYGEIVI